MPGPQAINESSAASPPAILGYSVLMYTARLASPRPTATCTVLHVRNTKHYEGELAWWPEYTIIASAHFGCMGLDWLGWEKSNPAPKRPFHSLILKLHGFAAFMLVELPLNPPQVLKFDFMFIDAKRLIIRIRQRFSRLNWGLEGKHGWHGYIISTSAIHLAWALLERNISTFGEQPVTVPL